MSIAVTTYCIKSATNIAKLAVEYRKIQEIAILQTELEQQKLISESILSYSKLIKNDVQSLMHMYFKSAYESLTYALTASRETQNEYLRHAISRFIDATTIEKNENLILSYLGLALCQVLTNDKDNSVKTLKRVKDVYCVLPNDIDELASMMSYQNEWKDFLWHYVIKGFIYHNTEDRFAVTFNDMFHFYHFRDDDWEMEIKEYFCRRLNVLRSCGGFSFDETIFCENEKRAMRTILQEDFESFKSEILLQFEIK